MLYDNNSTWRRLLAYNDVGSRGYVCLHFNGSYFDVLQGTGAGPVVKPPIPRRVVHQDLNAQHVS